MTDIARVQVRKGALRTCQVARLELLICTKQELLGHSDVSTTMIYTHVLKVVAGGTGSPLDALSMTA